MTKARYSQDVDTLLIELSAEPVDYAEESGRFIVHFNKNDEPVILEIMDAKDFQLNSLASMMKGTEALIL